MFWYVIPVKTVLSDRQLGTLSIHLRPPCLVWNNPDDRNLNYLLMSIMEPNKQKNKTPHP